MKNDKQMIDMLRNELEKSSESVKMPLKLQKESMVAMLKNEENKETDFSVKTGTRLVVIRRLAAAAAMLAVVVVGILAMRADGVRVIKRDTFYKSYEGAQIVKSAQSYEEIEVAVKEILGESEKKPVSALHTQDGTVQSNKNQTVADSEEISDKLYEGYRNIDITEKTTDVLMPLDGVEADIVKNNGKYLYIVTTGKNLQTGNMTEQIKIVRTSDKETEVVSTLTVSDNSVSGAFEECIEIHIKNNILIAILGKTDFDTEAVTRTVYYDISNPEKPLKIREHMQDGKYLFSSLNGSSFCLVTDKQVEMTETGLVPSFTVDGKTESLNAEEIFISVNDPEASFIFITVTDIAAFDKQVGRLAILGSGKQLYCSEGTIAATREFVSVDTDKNGEYLSFTEIYRFNINGSSISFVGSYVVEGSVVGGVCVIGGNGYMTAVSSAAESSNVYVFDNEMEFVSGLKQIFPQKKVESVRFIGEKGYISSNDETMIIDFSSPKSPKVAGEVSSKPYNGSLYEISDAKLLGVRVNDEATTLCLFDLSNSENSFATAEYTLSKNCMPLSVSDSRSVMVIPEKDMFGIPVVISDGQIGSEVSAYMLFDVSDGSISPIGLCRHDEHYVGDAAVRASYIDGTVYTVSGKRISSFSVDTFEKISECVIR